MDKYKYSIELSYNKLKEKKSEKIRSEQIKSVIIDRDYINTNMPVIFVNIALDKKMIDHMIKYQDSNTMVLTIYKYIYRENKLATKIKYVHSEMMYFIPEDLNYKSSIDYGSKENEEREDMYKLISIGLMGLNAINNNKTTVNTVLRRTTMISAVHYCTSHINMVIERFDYNNLFDELLIKPQSSTASCVKYLNDINVFYKTPYRFFIDFDCGYLLSSSGTSVPKKGESINSILLIISDPMDQNAMIDGMTTNHDTKNYQLYVSAADTKLTQNKITEKVYTSISSISEEGESSKKDLKVNKSKFSKDNTQFIRVPNSNPNLIENIKAAEDQTSSHLILNKLDVDLSIFTPNKRYSIKNYDGHKDRDGDFILTRKRDLFYLEADDMFCGNVMLEFDQVIKPNYK